MKYIPTKNGRLSGFLLALLLCSFNSFAVEPRFVENEVDHCQNVAQQPYGNLAEFLAPYQQKMQSHTGVYILEQGAEAMISRAWLSDRANKTIDVQYFIFSTDNIGLIAVDYLIRAAERGVKVRVLVDDIMIEARGDELLLLAQHENVEIKIYNPLANVGKNIIEKLYHLTTKFHQFNQRMHNKTFTVDGQVTITGGRNVADEYYGYDHQYNFRDRDVLLIGGETASVQQSFQQFWQHALSVPVQKLLEQNENATKPDFSALHQYACNPSNFLPVIRDKINNLAQEFSMIERSGDLHWLDNVQYISDQPGKNNKGQFLAGGGISTDAIIELAKKAKHSITVQTPYLVTTDFARAILKDLVERGVEVKILTNSLASNDNLEAFSGYQRDRKALLKTGVKLYEFKPDAKIRQKVMSEELQQTLAHVPIFGLHAKTMVIDDETTVIGTYNFDPRSANLNTESITVLPSKAISLKVKQGMLEEMQPENAWQVTEDWNPDHTVGVMKRFKVKLRRIVPKNIL
ncbi:phospholipase D-like domain-containing protein [Thalassotalea sp. PLHSN55]|uniref:phospholipase D-like domain-containing protein n=1 Tax=Thalassotalea sp. PLHSN55 TaxID=3435888 RepID=UPI003F8384A0